MQPTLCSKCKKNLAVIFISRIENGVTKNEGLCLKCAREMGVQPVDDMMKRMGITPEDLENINSEMMQAFGGAEEMNDLPDGGEDEDDEESGSVVPAPMTRPTAPAAPAPQKTAKAQTKRRRKAIMALRALHRKIGE